MFFHQFYMQINLLLLISKSIEIPVSIFTALYCDQNFSHKIHIPLHLSLLFLRIPIEFGCV